MSYSIPSESQVKAALKRVLRKAHSVHSQKLLTKLVIEDLETDKKSYGLSPHRLRLIALNSSFATVEIHSREGDPKKTLSRCPVCHHSLKRVKNLTIWGGEVTIQFKCRFCGYWTGKKKRVPTRYVFHYKKKNVK